MDMFVSKEGLFFFQFVGMVVVVVVFSLRNSFINHGRIQIKGVSPCSHN